ncbi:MAG: GNAT family N-acetyltransferase [Reichenbachiella sp.]
MLNFSKTNSSDQDFVSLVELLDADLKIRDGEDHEFYHQFNGIEDINFVVVAYSHNKAVGCGAIKELDTQRMEVKRMYVLPEERGNGFASSILNELEQWAKHLGYERCVLETGKMQPEAIALYQKCGYQTISNYGQYSGIENSLCFEKIIQ